MNRAQRRQSKPQPPKKERKQPVEYLAHRLEHAEPGWTVVIPKCRRAEVQQYITQQKEQEEYERRFDYDDHEDDECCRGCNSSGPGSTAVFGCCSMRCAKRADAEYD